MEAIGAADDAAAAVTTTEDAPRETTIPTGSGLVLPSTTATIAPADANVMMMIDAIAIETPKIDVVREVHVRIPRARRLTHSLLRMSVIGEPFSSNSSLRVFEPKS